MVRILAISSHVVRGHVGLCATVPALQWLGHEVWALPTVLLASRPELGQFVRHDLPPPDLSAMLSALEADGCWASLDAVFTGYFPSPDAVTAEAIARIGQANPNVLVLVDPILGDAGRLYISQETALAIRDQLLPLAQIATPNLFELQWLADTSASTQHDIAKAARSLGVPTVVVTSASQTADRISTVLVTARDCLERSMPAHPDIPNGAGDLFAGLLLGYLLNGYTMRAALDAGLQDLDRVLGASEGHPVLQLSTLTKHAQHDDTHT